MDSRAAVAVVLALTLAGCGASHTRKATEADNAAAFRRSVAFFEPFARQALDACRTDEIGCTASDMEYSMSDWSRASLDVAVNWSNVGVVGYVYVVAPETSARRITLAGPVSADRALVARILPGGLQSLRMRRCACVDP